MGNEVIKGMGYAHMALGCADFERSLTFYQALGLRIYTQWGAKGSRIALLDIGDGGMLELFEKPDMTPDNRYTPWLHFAFAVQDVDAAYTLALRAGAEVIKAPVEMPLDAHPRRITLRVAFVKGPSGEELEFFKQLVNRF